MESKGPDDPADAQDDLNLHILHMLKETFSLGMAQLFVYLRQKNSMDTYRQQRPRSDSIFIRIKAFIVIRK